MSACYTTVNSRESDPGGTGAPPIVAEGVAARTLNRGKHVVFCAHEAMRDRPT